ncbi:MAG TPA: NCS2 family permease [Syntrophales bacterium]|nr:NCS2 family permease [Syntrophales bacterium]
MVSRFFRIDESGSTAGTEVIAGMVTFMTMAYIIFVNPNIISEAGVPKDAAIITTCLAAGIATLLMGTFTNYPFVLAPGMGLNAFLAYGVVLGMNIPWQVGMGIIFLEGLIILILVLTKFRELIMDAISINLKRAIGVGIGLFIAFIGLKSAGMVVKSEATLVTFGSFTKPVVVASMGLVITAILMSRKVRGAILIGILSTTAVAVVAGLTGMPESLMAIPRSSQFATIGAAFDPRYLSQVFSLGMVTIIFAFLLTDFFDTLGTVVAVGGEAGFLDKEGKIPRIRGILIIDSLAAMIGGAMGCSSVTTYVESAAGVGEGGRTGLTAVVTALFFFLAVFFWPVISIVPAAATAPALIVVGFLMMMIVKDIEWNEFTEAFPAFLTILAIPLTYSISKGIGYGFISYVIVKIFSGKARDINPLMYLIALMFALDFLFSSVR